MTLLAIVGPTGIGKSKVAVAVARATGGEIVAVDSIQVYRGFDIGTGKPSQKTQALVPHHGIDLVGPEEEFNVAQYILSVRPAIEEIQARRHLPILVGGTGLYFKGLLEGLCEAPGKDAALRDRLEQEAKSKGLGLLYSRLQESDPASAKRIHPNDQRKVIRALEVSELTGRPMSQWQDQTPAPFQETDVRMIGLTCDRKALYQGIERRIDRWFESGWLEEAKLFHGSPLSQTAREALGYREIFDFLDGKADWEETVTLIKRNTRRYAKRQLTWFRNSHSVDWIPVDGVPPENSAERILTHFPWNEHSCSTSA